MLFLSHQLRGKRYPFSFSLVTITKPWCLSFWSKGLLLNIEYWCAQNYNLALFSFQTRSFVFFTSSGTSCILVVSIFNWIVMVNSVSIVLHILTLPLTQEQTFVTVSFLHMVSSLYLIQTSLKSQDVLQICFMLL